MKKPTDVVGRRVGAFILDSILLTIIEAIIYFPLAEKQDDIIQDALNGSGPTSTYANFGDYSLTGGKAALFFLIVFAISFYLLVVLPGTRGYSPGKAILGLRVVREDGSMPIGIGKSFVRQLMWIIDSFPYCIPYLTGFILAMTSDRNQRLGDRVAKTLVVDKEYAGSSMTAGAPVESSGGGWPPSEPSGGGGWQQPESGSPLADSAPSQPAPVESAPAPVVGTQAMPAIPVPEALPVSEPAPATAPADWYPDPKGEKRLRYWDGQQWTDHTAD